MSSGEGCYMYSYRRGGGGGYFGYNTQNILAPSCYFYIWIEYRPYPPLHT